MQPTTTIVLNFSVKVTLRIMVNVKRIQNQMQLKPIMISRELSFSINYKSADEYLKPFRNNCVKNQEKEAI